jgi:hypothetical protein
VIAINTKQGMAFFPLAIILSLLALMVPVSLTGYTVAEPNNWMPIEDANYIGGSALFSNTPGAKLEYNFSGSSLTIVTQKRDDFGFMNVYVDGVLSQYDMYSGDVVYQENISLNFDGGEHNIIIEVSNEKNNASSGYYIIVDDINFITEDPQSNSLNESSFGTFSVTGNNENLMTEDALPPNLPFYNYALDQNTLLKFEKDKSKIPENLSMISEEYFKSFMDDDDFVNHFKFNRAIIYLNTLGDVEYIFNYNYVIESTRKNGKKTNSVYSIKVKIDQNGNILDIVQPKELYTYLKQREQK